MDEYEKQNLTKEELEDLELAKAGFTRAEIKELGRSSLEPSISWDEFWKEIDDKCVRN